MTVDPVRVAGDCQSLNNAAKFTHPGGRIAIQVGATATESLDLDNGTARVRRPVADLRTLAAARRVRPGGLGIDSRSSSGWSNHGGETRRAQRTRTRKPVPVRLTAPSPTVDPGRPLTNRRPRTGGRILVVDDSRQATETLALIFKWAVTSSRPRTMDRSPLRGESLRPASCSSISACRA